MGGFKVAVLEHLDQCGAKYPAEHNIGHLYHASDEHQCHFRELDPTNSCNPGIGHTSKLKDWALFSVSVGKVRGDSLIAEGEQASACWTGNWWGLGSCCDICRNPAQPVS